MNYSGPLITYHPYGPYITKTRYSYSTWQQFSVIRVIGEIPWSYNLHHKLYNSNNHHNYKITYIQDCTCLRWFRSLQVVIATTLASTAGEKIPSQPKKYWTQDFHIFFNHRERKRLNRWRLIRTRDEYINIASEFFRPVGRSFIPCK